MNSVGNEVHLDYLEKPPCGCFLRCRYAHRRCVLTRNIVRKHNALPIQR